MSFLNDAFTMPLTSVKEETHSDDNKVLFQGSYMLIRDISVDTQSSEDAKTRPSVLKSYSEFVMK